MISKSCDSHICLLVVMLSREQLLHYVCNVTMSSWALSSLCRLALDLQSFECPEEAAEAYVLRLELVYTEKYLEVYMHCCKDCSP